MAEPLRNDRVVSGPISLMATVDQSYSRLLWESALSSNVRGEFVEPGAGDRDRTGDIQLGKLTFYH